jgi:hypothetical protein
VVIEVLTTDIASMSVNIGADLGNIAPMLSEFGAVRGNTASMLGESGAVRGNTAPVRTDPESGSGTTSALSTYQLVLQRVTGKVGVGAHFHFFQDPRPVGADRFDAEQQFICNFGNRLAQGQHPQHLVLPI